MSQKEAKCPHCGRELPNDLGNEESIVDEIVKCPRCGSARTWKDTKRYTSQGVMQRYYCRGCGRRFSKQQEF